MPFKKVPIVHKFGIISASQRLELQERLLQQTYLRNNGGKKASSSQRQRNVLQVSEDFVSSFNNAVSYKEKEEKARKMLERSKRRSGLRNFGKGDHVNIALAWTEMAQLAQCKGKIQGECLDTLIISLDVSPLEKYHISALFFLAETVLYWLRTDAVHQPFLKITEIKLLKMGQLVCERLFYHHMAGQLQVYGESKNRLGTYIEGLQDYQQLYDPYPEALLSLRFMIEVGKIILADMTSASADENTLLAAPNQNKDEITQSAKNLTEKQSQEDHRSVWSAAISSSVHDLSPTLWHALDVWRCTNSVGGGHQDALNALANCGLGLASETWIDGIVAIQILGDVAKTDMAALDVLFLLARGLKVGASATLTGNSEHKTFDSGFSSNAKDPSSNSYSGSGPSPTSSLSDIDEEGEATALSKGSSGKTMFQKSDMLTKSSSIEKAREHLSPKIEDDRILRKEELKYKEERIHSTSKLNLNVQEKNESAFTNNQSTGIVGWQWEVVVTYVDVLGDVALHGSSADIQKYALLGNNSNVSEILSKGLKNAPFESPCHSAGLFDLVFFRFRNDGDDQNWHWRVRYAAIQALTKVSHNLAGDTLREGLSTTVTNILLKANATEKDLRVLEALKIGQIHTDVSKFVEIKVGERHPSIGTQIASCLSSIYLPPIPPPLADSPSRQQTSVSQGHIKQTPRFNSVTKETKPLRTSVKQEIQLASPFYEQIPDYNTRKSFDLKRIVEDQRRKELQASLAEAEEEEIKLLIENQKNEELRQQEVASNKLEKFQKKKVNLNPLNI
ncbi:hypothetical protein Btru_031945 [Bulinus truncatus]|nr:hypothetical protein Btru_031945 [Bulinus truncatus]